MNFNQIESNNSINNNYIDKAFEVFQKVYENRVKKTTVESIINGEYITTDSNNIFVNTTTFDDPKFNDKCKLINKTLYKYQADAIKMIRQLELSDYYDNQGDKIYSNGYLLHLPIGSGKTLVFTFLAIMYRVIPAKPIIISTSGINIPEDSMIQLKYYPFYYENVGYNGKNNNCVLELKQYTQRRLTVIVTHYHLINQLEEYIKTDFKEILLNKTKIHVATQPRDIKLDCDILIVPCKPDIIQHLVLLSYEQPFMRVIVDDYTNMDGIEQYRQIRATFTLFVSGSGFERDKSKIPPSYYTLRHIDVNKYSLVAPVEETVKGVMRNNVATFNLIGSETDFSLYKFINEVDEYTLTKYRYNPVDIYKPIQLSGSLLNYFSLNFILRNLDRFNTSINMIQNDIKNNKLDSSRVSHFMKFKDRINEYIDTVVNSNKVQQSNNTKLINPFYKDLFTPSNIIPQGIQPIVLQQCQVCGNKPEVHNAFGFVACCCGSFFCSECSKSMVTRDVIMYEYDNRGVFYKYHDENNYYCTICHKCNPVFVSNCTRHKNTTNIQTYHLVDQYMDVSDLKNNAHVDYYFKMFNDGFKPRYFNGKVIETELDINYNKEFLCNSNTYKLIKQLFSKDRLAMISMNCIEETLKELNITPFKSNNTPSLLIYGCPDYMQRRLTQYFQLFSKSETKKLYKVGLIFKNSLSELIGLHQNLLGILVWNQPNHNDEIQQLIGRIIRLNNWNNPLCFYITCCNYNLSNVVELNSTDTVKSDEVTDINQTGTTKTNDVVEVIEIDESIETDELVKLN